MHAYQKERIENVICYFASEHEKRAEIPAYQTYIYKYLSIFDFTVLEKTGKPALDIQHIALPKGPVPRRLYDNPSNSTNSYYDIKEYESGNKAFKPKKEPDLNYFSKTEIEVMNQLLNEFAYPGVTTDIINEASHDIKAYRKAWAKRGDRKRVTISYDDQFDQINKKKEEDLSPEEETYLVHRALSMFNA